MKHEPYQSRIGDIAGDIKADPDFDPSWGYEKMKNYFHEIGACDNFLDALEFAYSEFKGATIPVSSTTYPRSASWSVRS
jgi:hypothetical protein